MQEILETPPPKPEADQKDNECTGQKGSATANGGMKVESDFVNLAPTEELQFLRSRVQELEREKAQMAEENRRLQDMLVNEIPSLLSSMRQTLSVCTTRANSSAFARSDSAVDGPGFARSISPVDGTAFAPLASPCVLKPERAKFMQAISNSAPSRPERVEFMQAISNSTPRRPDQGEFMQVISNSAPSRPDRGEFMQAISNSAPSRPERSEFMQAISNSAPRRPDRGEFMQIMPSDTGRGNDGREYVAADEEGGVVCPVVITDEDCHTCPSSACSSPDLPLVSDCSEMEHGLVSGLDGNHVRQVEVYPSSSVFCAARAWHAAIQAPSPTAMARTLLLGVFDMETLLQSNLRGGRSRRPTFPNHRAGLDPRKLDAIYNATLAKFPLARKGQIGTGINSKLSEIRFKSRRDGREGRYL